MQSRPLHNVRPTAEVHSSVASSINARPVWDRRRIPSAARGRFKCPWLSHSKVRSKRERRHSQRMPPSVRRKLTRFLRMCATAAGASFSLTFFISYLSSGIFEREEVSVLECRGSSGSRRNLDARDGKAKAVGAADIAARPGRNFCLQRVPETIRAYARFDA